MMKSKKVLSLCLAMGLALPLQGLAPVSAFAQSEDLSPSGEIEVQNTIKTFGGSGEERIVDTAVNKDGSYAVLLGSGSYDRNLTGVLSKKEIDDDDKVDVLVKYNSSHVLQWAKSTHIRSSYSNKAIKPTSDGGYVIVSSGNVGSSSESDDGTVLKLDADGNKKWSVAIGGTGLDAINQVIESADHTGLIIVGETQSNDGDFAGLNKYKPENNIRLDQNSSAFVMKLNADNGEIEWTNVIDGNTREFARGVVELEDRYVVAGGTASTQNDFNQFNFHSVDNSSSYDLFLAEINKTTGQLMDTPQSLGDVEREDLVNISPSNGGFVVLGTTGSDSGQLAAGEGTTFLAKYDQNSDFLWATRFGPSDANPASNIVESSPNVYSIGMNGEQTSIYTINAVTPSNLQVTDESAPFNLDWLFNLAGTPGHWLGVGSISNSSSVTENIYKGESDVAVFHPGIMSDEEAVTEAIYDPVINFTAEDDYLQWVTGDFGVNVAGDFGTSLTWTSNNQAVKLDASKGEATVQRAPKSGSDTAVKLTVAGKRNEVDKNRQIDLVVKKQSAWQQIWSGSEENPFRAHSFRVGTDGTIYTLGESETGEVLEKIGTKDTAFTALPSFPEIENLEYSRIVNFEVDKDNVYVYRQYWLEGNDSETLHQVLKLNGTQWEVISTAPVPEELAPANSEQLGEFTGYEYSKIAVDNGTIYQKVTAVYSGGERGSATRDLLLKWNGTQWSDVTPNVAILGITDFTVRDGKIYLIGLNDKYNGELIVSDGTTTLARQELTGGSTPDVKYEATIALGAKNEIYLLAGNSPDNNGFVWQGVINNQQTFDWTNLDDSYKFIYPRELAVSGQTIYVMQQNRNDQNIIIARSMTEDGSSGGDNGGNTGGDNGGNTGGNNGGNTGGNNGGSTGNSGGNTGSSGVSVLVNGKAEQAGTATESKRSSQTVTTIEVDQKKLEERLASEGRGAVVTIPVNSKSDVIVGELNGRMVKNMENLQAVLKLQTERAEYTLPANQINIDAISKQFGQAIDLAAIKLRIEVAAPTTEMTRTVESAAAKGAFTLIAPPLNFTVQATLDNKTVEVEDFDAYVERRVALPDGVDPNKITTGVIVDPDGTVRHVPTRVTQVSGKYYAVINSLTNSTYSVVWHPREFSDVVNHWAKNAVNDMGSRMVIEGKGDGKFSPNQSITRAEFAAIMVRGLGLAPEASSASFKDVKNTDWYSGVIQTAYTNNLIQGFEDGNFRPNDAITREQAMTILAKAMKITALDKKLPSQDASQALAAYRDADKIAAWAKKGVADSLQAGVVTGRSAAELAPTSEITRAEVAQILQRLLQKSGLI
ncbi:S-layer homology domain-containing protein [Paenibacillus sp. YPG26]|uniref:S-layer homology domain-containing protein n=1 Tax=Paenibacillus sp. YPG26 TaxID=2878915 RepID=UPI00203D9CD3|nr:S-layer homology domain-containing protein [Paenibacillus sp. YPG26]USB33395.1 S-layer homology domain-containing protein [Paenibacillus sp. YPG26]